MASTFDGVCASFSAKFVQLANSRFGTNHTELDQHDWDFKPWFTSGQVDEVWEQDIKPCKNFWLTLKPMHGTSGLFALRKDVEPVFITSRVPTAGMSAREQTCTWLRNWFFITYPNVIVVDNPTQKVAIVKALEIQAMVDDKIETVIQMNKAGVRGYCKLAPYNCQKSFPNGVLPVETLDAFLEQELKHGK